MYQFPKWRTYHTCCNLLAPPETFRHASSCYFRQRLGFEVTRYEIPSITPGTLRHLPTPLGTWRHTWWAGCRRSRTGAAGLILCLVPQRICNTSCWGIQNIKLWQERKIRKCNNSCSNNLLVSATVKGNFVVWLSPRRKIFKVQNVQIMLLEHTCKSEQI